ncbi:hypothetical protein [Cellulomonas sp. ATA003]|uniref:hypothetical protein n=1 Tax=Cellulomonas sp. ATA003 TaxID=3073064 RepID=UPI002873A4BF|nr:hypothetical protein [Cellulomonas sp. ATA003]WNB85134.1 hypothetical protein REH70_16015 [Cellulomonas sp. ATA003]
MAQHRILIVANRTLGGDQLVDAARERVKAGADAVWIVVPAAPPPEDAAAYSWVTEQGLMPPAGGGDRPALPDAYRLAETKLEQARDQFRPLGVPVDGEVGDEDPFRAIGDALTAHPCEEVLLSTLPRAVSHWLRLDLPSRVQRKYGVPVTTVPAPARQRT